MILGYTMKLEMVVVERDLLLFLDQCPLELLFLVELRFSYLVNGCLRTIPKNHCSEWTNHLSNCQLHFVPTSCLGLNLMCLLGVQISLRLVVVSALEVPCFLRTLAILLLREIVQSSDEGCLF